MKIINPQNGSGVFLMLLIIFIFTASILFHFNYLLSQWQQIYVHEKQYYQNYNQAYSALIWGQSQHWPSPRRQWQCQHNASGTLTACLKQSSQHHAVLLKGLSKTFPLYWIGIRNCSGKYDYLYGHWLDYCPEKKESDCD